MSLRSCLLMACLVPFVGCGEKSSFYAAGTTSFSTTFSVWLGEDFRAIPDQEVIVVARFSVSADKVARADMSSTRGTSMSAGGWSTATTAGFVAERAYRFRIPADAPLGPLTVSLRAWDTSGNEASDRLVIDVVSQQSLGDEDAFSWDLRFHAEHEQPENQIPIVSVFDVDATRAVMRPLFPRWTEEQIPYPIVLQGGTEQYTVGREEIPVTCPLQPGQGICYVLEDFLTPESDADYDFLFSAVTGPTELLVYADAISHMGAKNKTEVVLRNVASGYSKVSVEIHRRRRSGGDWSLYTKRTETLTPGTHVTTLWTDQKNVLNKDGNLHYSARIRLRLLP